MLFIELLGWFAFGVGEGYLTRRWNWVKYLIVMLWGLATVIVNALDPTWTFEGLSWVMVPAIFIGSLVGTWRADKE